MNTQWFGFIVKKTKNRNMMDAMELFEKQTPLCMVQCIDFEILFELKQDFTIPHNFEIGNWILTSGDCHTTEGIKIFQPFQDMDSAFEFARENFGVNNFVTPSGFNGPLPIK